ncbi:hypothetical protein [Dactylosporangium salmoneum]|uniref:Integral membrane protein n=1 Tax=Dactylosporangium salmoneum TaxID=53361 RepID=A0ABP5TH05_9ACTN
MSRRDEVEPLPAWVAWPIRVLAVIFVVPFKLAWELLVLVSRFLWRYVGLPLWRYVLRPVLYYGLWVPIRFVLYYLLWVPIRFLAVHVFWRPLAWFATRVLAPVFGALWDGLVWFVRALGPFWRLLGRVLLEVSRAVGWGMRQVYRFVLRPLGLAVGYVFVFAGRYLIVPVAKAIAYMFVFIGRYLIVPVAKAVAWAWNHSVVLLWRYLVAIPVSWVWRTMVVPAARWVRYAVLRPIAETTRRVLAAMGL